MLYNAAPNYKYSHYTCTSTVSRMACTKEHSKSSRILKREGSGERENAQQILIVRIMLTDHRTYSTKRVPHRQTRKRITYSAAMYTMYSKKKRLKISMESLEKFGLGLSMRQTSTEKLLTSID